MTTPNDNSRNLNVSDPGERNSTAATTEQRIDDGGNGASGPNSAATPVPRSAATPVHSSGESITPSQSKDLDTSKLKSEVWKHMFKRSIDGEIKAVCKYCDTKLAAASTSGTRHLHTHIKNCLEKRQTIFPSAFQKLLVPKKVEGKTQIANYAFDQDECRMNLVEMIILHEHPLSIVEQVGFKKFVNYLQPLFKIPSRSTIRRDIMKLYMARKKTIMELLDSNKGRVAITTDMWTADNQKKVLYGGNGSLCG